MLSLTQKTMISVWWCHMVCTDYWCYKKFFIGSLLLLSQYYRFYTFLL